MTEGLSPVHAHLKNPTMVDYPGHLAALFFLTGCNFKCGFCHNSQLAIRQDARLSWRQLSDICDGFKRQWVDAAVISGGEPTLDQDLPALIEFLRGYRWYIKLDTNGSCPDVLRNVLPTVDYVAMDVKCSLKNYPTFAGFDSPERINESMKLIQAEAKDYEFRTTVIETLHDDDEMDAIGELVRGSKRYVLQPFIPRDDLPDASLAQLRRTPEERLESIRGRLQGFADEVLISTRR